MKKQTKPNTAQYIHQTSYHYRERLVGLFVFAGIVLLLFFIFISVNNQHFFEKRVVFFIEVESSDGITQGSSVTALGTEVGVVSNLSLTEDRKIRVEIEVYKAQRKFIRKGATALVNRLTNIGNAQIEIKSEFIDAPMLEAGAKIPVEETPSLNDLMLGIANLIQYANNQSLLENIETILPKIEQTFTNIHNIIAQISTGHGVLGAAIFDQGVERELKVVVKSGAEILSEAEGIISIAKKRLVQLEPILDDATYMTQDLRGASHNLPETVKELNAIIAQVKTALALINGELQDIPGVTLDAKRSLSKTEQLLDSVQSVLPASKEQSTKQLITPHSSYD